MALLSQEALQHVQTNPSTASSPNHWHWFLLPDTCTTHPVIRTSRPPSEEGVAAGVSAPRVMQVVVVVAEVVEDAGAVEVVAVAVAVEVAVVVAGVVDKS